MIRARKSLLILLALALVFTIVPVAFAEEDGSLAHPWHVGKDDSDSVIVYYDGDTMNIDGSGYMKDFSDPKDCPWAGVVKTITQLIVNSDVKSIGNNAFQNLGQDVKICDIFFVPGGRLESVGEGAFANANLYKYQVLRTNVTTVGSKAYSNTPLERMTFEGYPLNVAEDAFEKNVEIVIQGVEPPKEDPKNAPCPFVLTRDGEALIEGADYEWKPKDYTLEVYTSNITIEMSESTTSSDNRIDCIFAGDAHLTLKNVRLEGNYSALYLYSMHNLRVTLEGENEVIGGDQNEMPCFISETVSFDGEGDLYMTAVVENGRAAVVTGELTLGDGMYIIGGSDGRMDVDKLDEVGYSTNEDIYTYVDKDGNPCKTLYIFGTESKKIDAVTIIIIVVIVLLAVGIAIAIILSSKNGKDEKKASSKAKSKK